MLRGIAAYVRRHHIALLALFFALGGTAVAASNLLPRNSVGSAQVINGSLQKKDLAGKAVKALKGNRGARGVRGAAGTQGPTGAQGIQGVQGPQGVPGTPATKLFAHITDTGALSSVKSGATAAAHNSAGDYTVTFNQSLVGCVAFAQIAFVSGVSGAYFNDSVARTSTSSNTVHVQIQTANDNVSHDGSFNLVVFC